MTRINSGVDPKCLPDKLLLAEHREITRIPNVLKKRLDSGKTISTIDGDFRLGTGHVTFFNDKLIYLRKRYIDLYLECIDRGFKVTNKISAFSDIDPKYLNDWIPTSEARCLIEERISDRGFSLTNK